MALAEDELNGAPSVNREDPDDATMYPLWRRYRDEQTHLYHGYFRRSFASLPNIHC